MAKQYISKNIRALLTQGFTADKLRAFCFDYPDFRAVYYEVASAEIGLDRIIARLLEYADQKSQYETLLNWAKEENQARYEEYQPYYNEEVEARLDPYALVWQNFRVGVEEVIPGAGNFFQAIDLLQQLSIPLYRELIIDLSARWSYERIESSNHILNKLEEKFLPTSNDSSLINVVPNQCKTNYALPDDDEADEVKLFIEVLRQYKPLLISSSSFFDNVCQFIQKAKKLPMQVSINLFNLFIDSDLKSAACFNLGVIYINNSDAQKNYYLEATQYFYSAFTSIPSLASKIPQSNFITRKDFEGLKTQLSNTQDVIIECCSYLNRKLKEVTEGSKDVVNELAVKVVYKAIELCPRNEKAFRDLEQVLDDVDQAKAIKQLKRLAKPRARDANSLYRAAHIAFIIANTLSSQIESGEDQAWINSELENAKRELNEVNKRSAITDKEIAEATNRIEQLDFEYQQLIRLGVSQEELRQKEKERDEKQIILSKLQEQKDSEQSRAEQIQQKIYNFKERLQQRRKLDKQILDEYQKAMVWAKQSDELDTQQDTHYLIEDIETKIKRMQKVY